MELVSVVGVILAAVLGAAVCVRRASLGDQMDSSYEQLKGRSGRPPLHHMKTRGAPVPMGGSGHSVTLGLMESDERVLGATMEVPRAS